VAEPTCRHGFPSLNAAAAEEALKFSGSRYILFYFEFKNVFAQVRGVDFAQNEIPPRNSLV
jgi:hypothetical protein